VGKYAFSIIDEVYKKTGKRLFPVKIKEWLKLGFVNMFAGGNGLSSSSGGARGWELSEPTSFTNITSMVNPMSGMASALPILIPLIVIFPLSIILFFLFINSLFTYVFIDSVRNESTRIRKSIRRVNKQSWTLFKFRILIITILIILAGMGIAGFLLILTNYEMISLIIFSIISILLLILLATVLLLTNFVVDKFLIPISYFKRKTIVQVWDYFKKLFKKNWVEIVFFFFGLLIVDLVLSVLTIILFIGYVLLMALLITPLIILLANYAWVLLILLVLLFFFSFYAMSVLTLPLSVFRVNYVLSFLGKIDKTIKY
jgi:hypothetical protein